MRKYSLNLKCLDFFHKSQRQNLTSWLETIVNESINQWTIMGIIIYASTICVDTNWVGRKPILRKTGWKFSTSKELINIEVHSLFRFRWVLWASIVYSDAAMKKFLQARNNYRYLSVYFTFKVWSEFQSKI